MLLFLSVIENIVILYFIFFVVFAHMLVAFSLNSKELHNARSLQENLARSPGNQSMHIIVAI